MFQKGDFVSWKDYPGVFYIAEHPKTSCIVGVYWIKNISINPNYAPHKAYEFDLKKLGDMNLSAKRGARILLNFKSLIL